MEGARMPAGTGSRRGHAQDLQELADYMRQHYVEAGDWWDNWAPGLRPGAARRSAGGLQADGEHGRRNHGMSDPAVAVNASRFASRA